MHRPARTPLVLLAAILVNACAPESSLPTAAPDEMDPAAALSTASPTANPTATWAFPLDDAALSVRSDRKFPDASGTYSLYANGVCSVSSTIFYGGSGDNTIQFSYPKAKTCGRTWTVVYPDGFSETLAYQGGVQVLENTGYAIPIGATVLRHMRFGTGRNGNPVASRCGQGLVFGPGGANPALGSDSVSVHRVDASTWEVSSQPAPNDRAYCIDNGQLYSMRISFRIVASGPLP